MKFILTNSSLLSSFFTRFSTHPFSRNVTENGEAAREK